MDGFQGSMNSLMFHSQFTSLGESQCYHIVQDVSAPENLGTTRIEAY